MAVDPLEFARLASVVRRFIGDEEEVDAISLRLVDGSPWLQIELELYLRAPVSLALWKHTGAIYRVDSHGAAADDPVASLREAIG